MKADERGARKNEVSLHAKQDEKLQRKQSIPGRRRLLFTVKTQERGYPNFKGACGFLVCAFGPTGVAVVREAPVGQRFLTR